MLCPSVRFVCVRVCPCLCALWCVVFVCVLSVCVCLCMLISMCGLCVYDSVVVCVYECWCVRVGAGDHTLMKVYES